MCTKNGATSIYSYYEAIEILIDVTNELWYPRIAHNFYPIMHFLISRKEMVVVKDMLDTTLGKQNNLILNLKLETAPGISVHFQIDLDYPTHLQKICSRFSQRIEAFSLLQDTTTLNPNK